jgi:anti-anti-sigma regulatory factor
MNEQAAHGEPKYIRVSDTDNAVVVCFTDLDGLEMGEYEKLAEELQSIVERSEGISMILDFEGKGFIPWAALEAVLVRLHKKLDSKLRMCNLPPNVTHHFEMNRLLDVFHTYATREEALATTK